MPVQDAEDFTAFCPPNPNSLAAMPLDLTTTTGCHTSHESLAAEVSPLIRLIRRSLSQYRSTYQGINDALRHEEDIPRRISEQLGFVRDSLEQLEALGSRIQPPFPAQDQNDDAPPVDAFAPTLHQQQPVQADKGEAESSDHTSHAETIRT